MVCLINILISFLNLNSCIDCYLHKIYLECFAKNYVLLFPMSQSAVSPLILTLLNNE